MANNISFQSFKVGVLMDCDSYTSVFSLSYHGIQFSKVLQGHKMTQCTIR